VGVNAVEALHAVGMGVSAAIDRNHTLPVLQLLHLGNLIFGVFPMVGSCSVSPWFRCMGDALEAMSQIMEVRRINVPVLFCSDHFSTGGGFSA
jgi:hypothetical protein